MKLMTKLDRRSFYILSFTWGIFLTLCGLLVAGVMVITGHRPKRWKWCIYFEVGKNWGGMEWGPVFLKDRTESEHIKNHEFGHAIQNCFFGPLMIPLICIPSSTRYWKRRIQEKRGIKPENGYDSIWFEGLATKLGYAYDIK
ncbi:MAG: hypothetical protein ACOX71_01915 [Lachnospiraceae bacterium]|jgi:hypothetical protein